MEYIIKSDSYRLYKDKIDNIFKDILYDNIITFDMEYDDIKDIINECNYISLFDDRKGILVYNSYIFNTKYQYKDENKILEEYLLKPNKLCELVFLTDSISKTKNTVKKISDNNNLIILDSPKNELLKDSINKYVLSLNYKIEYNALVKLIDNLNNYDLILNEIDKIIIIKKDYIITLDDVLTYSSKNEVFDLFKYIDYFIEKDRDNLMKYIDYVNNNIESSIIFSNIMSQYRIMYSIKFLEGYTDKMISDITGINSYRINILRKKSYNYTIDELYNRMSKIIEIDKRIKKGLLDKNVSLLYFINTL